MRIQVRQKAPTDDAAYSVALVPPESGYVEGITSLFERIAAEQSWRPGNQLRAYPKNSVYFALLEGETLAGSLQLVVGNADEGLPCLTVWPELGLQSRNDVADIALLALDKPYRGREDLFWLLCVEMWRYCWDTGIRTLWVEVTPAKLRLYRRLGWPLEIAGQLRKHWDEDCYPCCMSTEGVRLAIEVKAEASPKYRKLLERAYR